MNALPNGLLNLRVVNWRLLRVPVDDDPDLVRGVLKSAELINVACYVPQCRDFGLRDQIELIGLINHRHVLIVQSRVTIHHHVLVPASEE